MDNKITTSRKVFKYTVNILIIIAVLLEVNAIRFVYTFLNLQRTQVPIDSNLFLTAFLAVAFMAIIYVISYLISLILIIKNKKIGYLISGIASLLVFGDAIQKIVQNNISITLIMGVTSVFWIVLIIMSFVAYFKSTELEKLK